MVFIIDQLLQRPAHPNVEAQLVAANRVVKHMSQDEQSLYNLLKVIERGSEVIARDIEGGRRGDSTSMRAYGIMAECWQFLFARGITKTTIDKVVEQSRALDEAIGMAG